VDVVKLGDPAQPLKGIVTTFLPTYEVIQQTVQLGANLLIPHEPLFYNHPDHTDWLQDDSVYKAKRHLVENSGLVIWRFHDYVHSMKPDPISVGTLQALGWESYSRLPDRTCQIPPMKLGDLVDYVKAKLGIQTLRYIGDPNQMCQTVAVMPGFHPVQMHTEILRQPNVDALICGEIHEWETSEYTRDALRLGQHKALIVTGHAASEEFGMRGIIPWLQGLLPGVPIQFIPMVNAFRYQ
jgi:putative NIF3 family GTP cyclohydrolase 1 type 2